MVASPLHIEQLISNLVSNAIAYSPKDSHIDVSVKNQTLTIIDRGPGIPKSVKDRLGEPFNRGGADPTVSKGSGLGLAWVKSICRLYSWEMSVQSSDQGSEILVKFPQAEMVMEIQTKVQPQALN